MSRTSPRRARPGTPRRRSSVTALSRSSRLTTNGAASMAASAAVGVGQVGELDAADQQRARVRRRARRPGSPAVSRPGGGGQRRRRSTPAAVCCAGRRVGDGAAAGQQVGQRTGLQRAAFAGAPRDPRQPGTGGVGQSGCRRKRSGGGGQPLADQDDRARAGSCARRQAVQRGGLAAGRGRDEPAAPSWSARGWRTVRSTITCRPCLRTALRSRRNTIGDSSSGSSPASSTAGAVSRSA